MDILHKIYENDVPKIDFIDRKSKIDSKKTIIYGPPRSGKSYIAYDFLSQFEAKNRLYINLDDLRIDYRQLQGINEFMQLNNIEAVVVDNYDETVPLPICENIILICKTYYKIDGFYTLLVMPLDFEEFLVHDTKHQNTTTSFNNFLKFGNFPENITLHENKKIKRIQEIIRLISKDDMELQANKTIINSLGEKTSVFNLFNQLKRNIKVSKDRFYQLCKRYEEQHIIFFVPKFDQPKALKKLFLYNHSLKNAISFSKNFKAEFANVVFLELLRKYKEIYYLDGVDFYLDNGSIIMCVPFFNDMMIGALSSKIFPLIDEYNIKSVTIICVNDMQKSFFIGEIECIVVPFFVWALL